MKKWIVYGLCLLCFMVTGCGGGTKNDSALAAIGDGDHEEENVSWEDIHTETDSNDSIVQDDVLNAQEEGALAEPENGHIIAHNPDYRAPVFTAENIRDSNGVVIDGSFSYMIPENFSEAVIDGSLIYVLDEDKGSHSIYVYTEDISGSYPEDALAGYDISIKEEFGSPGESGIEEYNGLKYSHYLYDENNDGEHGFINTYVFANETGLIYIEFYDTATVYDMADIKEFMNHVYLKQ